MDENLAAYMARMVVIDNVDRFPPDRVLSEADVEELLKVLPRTPHRDARRGSVLAGCRDEAPGEGLTTDGDVEAAARLRCGL